MRSSSQETQDEVQKVHFPLFVTDTYSDWRHLGLFCSWLWLLRGDIVNCGTKGLMVIKPWPLVGKAREGLRLVRPPFLLLELRAGDDGAGWAG